MNFTFSFDISEYFFQGILRQTLKSKKKAFLFEGVPLIVLQFIFNVIYIAHHNNCCLKVLFIL